MTNQTTSERCQGGQPQGVKGGSVVRPTFLDAQFHRAQARLKSKALRSPLAQKAVEPFFTGLAAKHNDQRIAEYEQRMARYTGVAA